MGGRKYFDPEIETMDRPALEKLQMERLQWQLKRCYEESPFYQERFKKAGIKPEDIRSLEEMIHIPPVTKEELREEQLAYPPFEDIPLPRGKTGRNFTHRREPLESPSTPYGLTGMSKTSPPGPLGRCGTSALGPAISSKMHSAMGYG